MIPLSPSELSFGDQHHRCPRTSCLSCPQEMGEHHSAIAVAHRARGGQPNHVRGAWWERRQRWYPEQSAVGGEPRRWAQRAGQAGTHSQGDVRERRQLAGAGPRHHHHPLTPTLKSAYHWGRAGMRVRTGYLATTRG